MGSAAKLSPFVSTLDGLVWLSGNVVQLFAQYISEEYRKKDMEVFTSSESMLISFARAFEKKEDSLPSII